MFGLLNEGSVIGKAGIVIDRPADTVFEYIGHDFFRNYPRWSPEVIDLRQLTPGSVGLGTRGKQIRIDQGRRSESTFTVAIYEPAQRIRFDGMSDPFRCDYQIEAVNEHACRLIFIFELLRLELYMRPFEKLIRLAVQDGAERTIRNIKRLIESDNVTAATQTHAGESK